MPVALAGGLGDTCGTVTPSSAAGPGDADPRSEYSDPLACAVGVTGKRSERPGRLACAVGGRSRMAAGPETSARATPKPPRDRRGRPAASMCQGGPHAVADRPGAVLGAGHHPASTATWRPSWTGAARSWPASSRYRPACSRSLAWAGQHPAALAAQSAHPSGTRPSR